MELNVRQGYMKRHDEFDQEPLISMKGGETGRFRDFVMSENKEWFLEATVRVTFWANQAQFHGAREIAERALKARLYEGMLTELHRLRLAISNGDRAEAFAAVDRAQKLIEG